MVHSATLLTISKRLYKNITPQIHKTTILQFFTYTN